LAAQGCEQAAGSAPEAAAAPEASADAGQAAQIAPETAPTDGEQAASTDGEQATPETDSQAAAPAEAQQATEAPAPPAAQPEGPQSTESASDPQQNGDGNSTTVPIGGTAVFGDTRVFVSAIGETDASLFLAGKGRQTVATGSALDAGNGCMVTLAGIEGGQVQLTAEGCAGGGSSEGQAAAPATTDGVQPAAAADAETAAPTAEEQPTDAAGNGAEAAPAADTGEAAAPAADEPAAPAVGDTAGVPASGLTTGQTATFGEKKIFVSAITEAGATLQVIGGARQRVETGSAIDLGEGCAVTLDKVEDRSVFLSGTGC
ncbi:hypothetical protein, partial [Aurantimonas marianensis]|nr:hypothetical protein [Aurantimonas marianensis]